MSTSAYRRCRRDQIMWRARHQLRAFLTDPAIYWFASAVFATSTVISSLWVAVI